MESIKPILKKPPTYCLNCKANTIDIYTCYDKPVGYFNIMRQVPKSDIEMELPRNISYMKCSKCGAMYRIDWESDIPRPLYDNRVEKKIKNGTIFVNTNS